MRPLSLRLLLPLAVACWSFSCSGGGPRESTPRPDVVLIVVDTLRADRLGCYGYPRPTSPVIDACAEEGVLFENAFSQSSWTLPSMASMLTGEYVTAYQDWVAPDSTTVAETFREAGYQTLALVTNHLVTDKAGYSRGFEVYDNYEARYTGRREKFRRSVDDVAADVDRLLANAVSSGPERRPVFLFVHLMDVHTPYRPHEEFAEVLPKESIAGTEPGEFIHGALRERALEREDLDEAAIGAAVGNIEGDRSRYEREVRYTDRGIGLILKHLRTHGIGDDAIKVLAADHGEGLYEHPALLTPEKAQKERLALTLQRGHGHQLYQELIATPLVFWGGEVPKGRRIEEPVENLDVFSTLLELCNIRPPSNLNGRSLVPLMTGAASGEQRLIFSFVMPHKSVYDPATGFKYIEPTENGELRGGVPRLYDLRSDPKERNNLADSKPEVVERMSALLQKWSEDHPAKTKGVREWTDQDIQDLLDLGYTGDQIEGLQNKRAGKGGKKVEEPHEHE